MGGGVAVGVEGWRGGDKRAKKKRKELANLPLPVWCDTVSIIKVQNKNKTREETKQSAEQQQALTGTKHKAHDSENKTKLEKKRG